MLTCSKDEPVVEFTLEVKITPNEGGSVSPKLGVFIEGEEVTLNAIPSSEYFFKLWSGSASGTNNPITVTMNSDKNITAIFEKKKYDLTVEVEGGGVVTQEVISSKPTDIYPSSAKVQLTAVSNGGWEFVRWEKDYTGTENPIQISLVSNMTVKAVFQNTSQTIHVGNLIWEDNFNKGYLDLSKWNYETGTGVNGDWGTGQLDRATDRAENVSFQNGVPGAEDGCLVISTRKENYIDRNYTSGRINTSGKAAWGPGHRIVAKVYPRDINQKGQGFAFWAMPNEIPNGWDYIMWPQGGEVDIMEYVGSIPYHNLGGVHYAWFWENNQWQLWNHGHLAAYYSYENKQVPNPAEPDYGGYPPTSNNVNAGSFGFHNYGIDWFDDRMEFFIDNNIYHVHYFNDGGAFQTDGQDELKIFNENNKRVAKSEYSNHFDEWFPFEHEMFAILSGGVGGSQNTYGGAIIPEATFPCSVFIDWVRVYEIQ